MPQDVVSLAAQKDRRAPRQSFDVVLSLFLCIVFWLCPPYLFPKVLLGHGQTVVCCSALPVLQGLF